MYKPIINPLIHNKPKYRLFIKSREALKSNHNQKKEIFFNNKNSKNPYLSFLKNVLTLYSMKFYPISVKKML